MKNLFSRSLNTRREINMVNKAKKFKDKIEHLPRQDKTLLGAIFTLAFFALAVGGFSGLVTVSQSAGFLDLAPSTAYKFMTLHAAQLFYFWLYLMEFGVILLFILVYTKGAKLTKSTRGLAWGGFALIAIGLFLNLAGVVKGAIPSYRAEYPLITQYGTAGVAFLMGYILLSVGLFVGAIAAVAAALKPKLEGKLKEWSSITFASVVWMGLIVVTLVAALLTYIPELQASLGMTPSIKGYNYSISWGVMFHNLHYMPILGAVLVWYVLVEITTGVKSVFSERFSKGIFALYLFVVPPTSVYHMFLEPSVPSNVKVVGSILSLGVSIPTVGVGALILASLQACAPGRGMLTWLRRLPWRNPSFSALAMAMVSALGGGVVANVIIQEKFERVLGDTFAVPGYFHFFTLGAITLAFFGILLQIIPALSRHRLNSPSLLNALPYAMVVGLYIFGIAGVWAGYAGVPRRTLMYSFGGASPEAWTLPMVFVGIGGVFMVVSTGLYFLLLAITAIRDSPTGARAEELPYASLRTEDASRKNPWLPFAGVAVLLAGIYLASVLAYQLIQSLPIIVAGGGH